MKTRKRILAAVLTAIMMISLLPANTFATETVGNGEAESAVEAVSVSTEEQDVETTVEDVSEDLTEETSIESSETDEVEETADPAAEETIETVEETVEQAEEAEAAAEPEKSSPVTLEKEGSDYVVTVTYDASALLPEGTDIMVKEIKETAKKYDSYYDQALEAVQKENEEAEEISYIRLFDISLVDGAGSKVEPKSAVDVQIRLKDVETVEESTQIVHFAGEEEIPEVIEPTTVENDTVAFATEGFSIYAVVTTGEFARLTVNFNVSEGNTTTMYVKQKDITEGKLNQVLYDPGVPVQDGKKFLGWTDDSNWTSRSLEELEENAKTIDDVRSDVTETLNAVPGITDGQTVDYYPIMVNIFELYYQDEYDNTFKTESLLSATDSATTTVDLAYSLTGGTATQNFIGWKVKGGDGTVYPNGSEITISLNTTLIPAIGDGRWLWFDSNAGGAGVSEASYTAPQFVADGKTPTEPAAPTRPGYQFDGWFVAPDGDEEFVFSKPLNEYTVAADGYVWAYAHWTAEEKATYKVVIWAQKVTDDKNAADDAKTYDYVETYTVSGAVAGTVLDEAELRNSSNNYFGKDNAYFGADDLKNGSKAFEYDRIKVERGIGNDGNGVNPDGSTVVNVYYDRALMTIACGEAAVVGPDGTPLPQEYYYEQTTDTSGTIYGRVNGEYVQLTRRNAGKRVEWGKYTSGTPSYYDPAPQYIWTNRTSAVQQSTSNRYEVSAVVQANASTINNASAGTSFTRINTSTMVFTSGSQGSQFYARVGSSAELAACYVLQNYAYTVQSTGEEYTGIIYKRSTKPAVMTGLYGQKLSQYDYSWPRPSSGGTWDGIAFLDTFTGSFFGGDAFGETPNSILLTKDPEATNLTMVFYLQDKDNPDQYHEVDRAGYALNNVEGGKVKITERILGGTSKDYSWSTSDSMPTDTTAWHTEIDTEGRTAYTRSQAGNDCTYIHIRYDRVANNIIFMQGTDVLKTVGPVRYEESLAGYEDDAPDSSEVNVGDDEFFAGWYEDPEGVKRVIWDELTMPLGNKIIYAVVRHSQYHVYVDMDGGTLPNAQRNQFWENWGRTIDKTNFMNATKTDEQGNRYTLVGYYWDEELTKPWNFDIPLSEEYLWHKYDDSHGEDPYRRSEFFGEDNYDSGYPQCVGIFRLWAKWRNESILNKGGLNIRYRNPGEDETDDLYVDPMHYADMSDVIAAQAPEEEYWPDGKRFDGWQLTEGKVYQPGDVFVADSDDAVIENDKYWITLTAVYVDKEDRTPTHVTWYKNDGSGEYYHTDNNYSINQPITIYGTGEGQAIPTREGYKFLGWAKDTERENAEDEPNTSTDETTANFLEYKEDGNFYLPGTTTVVTAVAADEVLPYEALYAIWEPTKYYIYHSATGLTTDHDIPAGGFDNIAAKTTSGYLYGGYYEYDEEATDPAKRGTVITDQPGTNVEIIKGHTYYLKEVDQNYLKPQIFLVYSKIHGGLIRSMYGFVDYDTQADYTDGGLVIGDRDISIWGEGNLTDGSITVKKESGNESLTPSKLFGLSSAVFGYTDLTSYVKGGEQVLIKGYYVTKDGVKVTGSKTRVIKFAADEPAYNAPVFTGWTKNGGNTLTGIVTGTPDYTPVTSQQPAGFALMRSLTITAPADTLEYTITKVYDSGLDLQTVEEGSRTGEITYAERSGYYFAGWYMDSDFATPADFSDVKGDMTVYAKYVKAGDISVSFTRKSSKSGTTTFNTTVAVKGDNDLTDVTVTAGSSASVLGSRSLSKSGSGRNVSYTTQYKGTSAVKGLSLTGSFTASVAWTTADGTAVSGPAYKCTYILGLVSVR